MSRLEERIISRRDLLAGMAGFGTAITIGCVSSSKDKNPANPISSPISSPEQTPKKEGLSGQLGFLPFEVLGAPENDDPNNYYNLELKEGFRWEIIKLAIENLSNEPLTLDSDLLQAADPVFKNATVTTEQGFEYPATTNDLGAQIGKVSYTPIIIPPGFRFNSLQENPTRIIDPVEEYGGAVDVQGNPYDYETYISLSSCMAFSSAQVPQNATGLKLNISGYDPIDIDSEVSKNSSKPAYDKPQSEFEDAIGGSVFTPDGNIQVTIKDFKKLENPQSIIPGPENKSLYDNYQFYEVVLSYANPDQGYSHPGKLTIYSVAENGDVYIVYDTIDANSGRSGFIGFDEIGPNSSKDYTLHLVYPKSVKDAKLVLQGQDLAIFNAPLVAS